MHHWLPAEVSSVAGDAGDAADVEDDVAVVVVVAGDVFAGDALAPDGSAGA